MMLFSTERVFRRSVAPAAGVLSSTAWVLVVAWMVDMDAVSMVFVASRSSRGRIMWARAVVVQEAAERTR